MNGVNPGFISAIRGPMIMITIGVLFLLDKFTPFQFGETWPVILILLGVMALAGGSGRSLRGRASVPLNGPADYQGPAGYQGVPPAGPSNSPPYTPPYNPPYNPNAPPPGARR